MDEARQIIDRLRAITPITVPRIVSFRDPEYREFYLSGVRLAAGEGT
jgi:hypothetical protein